jgi:glycerol-3-phosphate acyltransferase PlsY
VLTIAAVALISYFIGSVPAGYLAGRLAGVDIRTVGSGNVGATNALRTLGKPFGYAVFLFDFGKGVAAVAISIFIYEHSDAIRTSRELCGIIAGVCCVIGHVYPIWLRFKGGKGVATSAGVLFALMPVAALVVGVIWIVVFQATRYVSIASVLAAVAAPLAVGGMLWIGWVRAPVLLYLSLFLAAIVVFRHRSNFSRLLSGAEQRFPRK